MSASERKTKLMPLSLSYQRTIPLLEVMYEQADRTKTSVSVLQVDLIRENQVLCQIKRRILLKVNL